MSILYRIAYNKDFGKWKCDIKNIKSICKRTECNNS